MARNNMSYFGSFIHISNRPIKDIVKELRGYKKAYKNKEVFIGARVCTNECGMHGECTCDTYSIETKEKSKNNGRI